MSDKQKGLFNAEHYMQERPAPTRPSDPQTSHDAAQSVDVTAGEQRALELVRQYPGRTSFELDQLLGLGDGVARKRLAALKRRGLIRVGDKLGKSPRGRDAELYYPVEG